MEKTGRRNERKNNLNTNIMKHDLILLGLLPAVITLIYLVVLVILKGNRYTTQKENRIFMFISLFAIGSFLTWLIIELYKYLFE